MEKQGVKRPGMVLLACAMGSFLATFNETFFNVALVPIMNDLGVTAATAQWLITANMLVAAVFVPITGFLYRTVPTKPLYLTAVGTLIIGSGVGLVSHSFIMVLIARIIQAIGAGMVPVVCMNMTLAAAPKNRLGTYIGIVGAMTTLGPSSSPLISGIVLTVASWQMLFGVYGVLTVICFVYGCFFVENVAELTKPKLDIASTVLISLSLIGIMYGISTAFAGTPLIAAGSFILGVVLLVIFVRRQKKIESPLIDMRPFSSRAFVVAVFCVLFSLMSVFSMNIIMPTFMQESLGFTALSASITLFPAVACACIFSPVGGRLFDRFGIRPLAPTGMSLIFVFEIALLILVNVCGIDTPAIWIAVLYAPVIAAAQFVIGPSQSFGLSHLPQRLNTHGVVVLSTCFQIAGCLGTSLFVGMYTVGENMAIASGVSETLAGMTGFTTATLFGVLIALLGIVFGFIAGKFDRDPVIDPEADAIEDGELTDSQRILDHVMQHDVYVATTSQSVYEAMAVMVERKTSGLPVIDEDNRVRGFLDAGDVVRYLADEQPESSAYAMLMMRLEGHDFETRMEELKSVNVMELATTHIIATDFNDGIDGAAKVLSRHSIKKVPVLQDGHLVGTVSRSDLMRRIFQGDLN